MNKQNNDGRIMNTSREFIRFYSTNEKLKVNAVKLYSDTKLIQVFTH